MYFTESLAQCSAALECELAIDFEAVAALKAFFEVRPEVTREEFQAVTAGALARHPGILALEWVPRVRASERARHEAEGRSKVLTGYRITQETPSGERAPAEQREDYFPVFFAQPVGGNEAAFGFDVSSERVRREALVGAAETGLPVVTDPVRLVQESSSSKGVVLFLAVYKGSPDTRRERWQALEGFVLGVLRIDGLIEQMLRDREQAMRDLTNLELSCEVDGNPEVIYSGLGSVHGDGLGFERRAQPIAVGGKQWHLSARPSEAYISRHRTGQPVGIGLSSLLGWELLLGLALVLEKRVRDAKQRRKSSVIRTMLRSLADGVVVADTRGRFLMVNEAARRMVGEGGEGVPPAEWSRFFGLYVPGTDTLWPTDRLPLVRAIRGEQVVDVEVFIRNSRVPAGAWLSINGTPLTGDGGEVVGGVIVFRDITAGRQVDALNRRLSNALQQTADGVLITDQGGIIQYVNSAFEALTGYSAEEVLGENPRIFKSGRQSPDYYAQLWATILNGDAFKGTVVNRKKNGDLIYSEQTINPIKDDTGAITHFVSVLRDKSERMKLEEQQIEMRLASSVQKMLFPQRSPLIDGYDIAGTVSPALATCGDYFDFIQINEGRWMIAVADVCGHGMGPALIMAETRAYLRSLTDTGATLGETLTKINRFLTDDLDECLYVTMILVSLDTRTGAVEWANAGHPSGYVVDPSGAVKATLKSTGVPLGLFPDRRYRGSATVILERDELIMLLTDGVAEARSPEDEELGITSALEVVAVHRRVSAEEIVDRVHEAVKSHAGGAPQEDDVTVVVCKRGGVGPNKSATSTVSSGSAIGGGT